MNADSRFTADYLISDARSDSLLFASMVNMVYILSAYVIVLLYR